MSQPVQGRCLCGACTFSVTLRDENVDACHCGQCRTWAAGPFMDVMALSAPVFDDQDAVGVYRSSEWGERLFCKTCGSALAWRFADDHDKIAISAFKGKLCRSHRLWRASWFNYSARDWDYNCCQVSYRLHEALPALRSHRASPGIRTPTFASAGTTPVLQWQRVGWPYQPWPRG